jgi:hypothetical protein
LKIEEILRAKNQRPFQPFRIRLTDGQEIPISHPDAVAWEDRDHPRVLMALSGGERYWIEVALITAIAEAVPPPIASDGGT